MCLGLLLMPFVPILSVDLMVLGKGYDMFHRFDVVKGTVQSVFPEQFDVRASRGGQFGALYTRRVRPVVEYQFAYQGKRYTSTRYYLFEHNLHSDLASRSSLPGSVTEVLLDRIRVGSPVSVKVAHSDPVLSYVEFGWPVIAKVCGYWARLYLFLITFGSIVYGLIAVSRSARKKSQRL